jgi:predicted glycoside hydrolase/deacetylase ChbG (UPF0249 family)
VATQRKRLVVNADDFGWSRSVNAGIVETHVSGIVTRTSLIAAGSAFDDAVELARATPTLGVGVHLQIYRGPTILPAEQVASLVGPDGRFFGSWKTIVGRLATGRFDLTQVEAELRAQIQRVLSAGIVPTHFDSEKHLHIWPSVFDVVCKLAEEFSVPQVRVIREPFSLHPISLGLDTLSSRDAARANRCGLATPDGTIGVTEQPTDISALERLLGSARGDNVEFVVHPGHIDDDFMALQAIVANKLVESREQECRVLSSGEARELVERFGYELAQ